MSVRSKSLRGSKLLGDAIGGEEDPMSSMGNLMDVMLVFACGLMIALIAHYNVELSPSDPQSGEIEKLEAELEQAREGVASSDSTFAEMGLVYRDTETGELYLVTPEEAPGAGESATG